MKRILMSLSLLTFLSGCQMTTAEEPTCLCKFDASKERARALARVQQPQEGLGGLQTVSRKRVDVATTNNYSSPYDPLEDMTRVVSRHSMEPKAKQSVKIARTCGIGHNSEISGLNEKNFYQLVDFDPLKAKQCLDMLYSYRKYDNRFKRTGSREYHAYKRFKDKMPQYASTVKQSITK